MTNDCLLFGRRSFLAGGAALGGLAATGSLFPAWAQSGTGGIAKPLPTLKGTDIALTIHRMMLTADGETTHAIGINGTVPAPLLRLKEGQNVRLSRSEEHTSELQSLMRISYAVFCLKKKKP